MLVQVWSDVVCPWCAIGRARLGRALDALGDPTRDEVEVRWRSFELDPDRAATTDVDYVAMLAGKYRTTIDQAQAMIDRMTAAGAEDGIDFRFDIARPGNTFDAHRLIHLGAAAGRQHEVKARFLDAYHGEGAAIADHGTLTRLAVEAGLDEDEVTDVLDSDRYAQDVRADEQQAYDHGISGVPFFVVDGVVGLSGAQPPEVILEAMAEARRRTASAATGTADADGHAHHDHPADEACVDGVCAV